MERSVWCLLLKNLLWAAVIMQVTIMTTADIAALTEVNDANALSEENWIWGSWSSWTPCSKTCGGGVSLQKRECIPRQALELTSNPQNYLMKYPSVSMASRAPCEGSATRYHECNTEPCPESRDSRAEQCSLYDRRPFRGRYYNWVPYVDGNSPCTLNCRPVGKQFYASLALVTDGTPCTKSGHRAICIQGVCKGFSKSKSDPQFYLKNNVTCKPHQNWFRRYR